MTTYKSKTALFCDLMDIEPETFLLVHAKDFDHDNVWGYKHDDGRSFVFVDWGGDCKPETGRASPKQISVTILIWAIFFIRCPP